MPEQTQEEYIALENHVKKVRKRPVEVEAVHWNHIPPIVLINFTNHLVQINEADEVFKVYDRLHDAWIPFKQGDWIIKGVKGEFYPCDGEVFKETYEILEPTQESSPAYDGFVNAAFDRFDIPRGDIHG